MRIAEDPTDPIGKLISPQKTVGFYDLALSVNPLGLDGVLSHGLCFGRRQPTILTRLRSPWLPGCVSRASA